MLTKALPDPKFEALRGKFFDWSGVEGECCGSFLDGLTPLPLCGVLPISKEYSVNIYKDHVVQSNNNYPLKFLSSLLCLTFPLDQLVSVSLEIDWLQITVYQMLHHQHLGILWCSGQDLGQ
jgi:hypothetical protein